MYSRFSDEGWNQLINPSIRWLIGDIKTERSWTRVLFHCWTRVIVSCLVIVGFHLLINYASRTYNIEEKIEKRRPLRIETDLESVSMLSNGTISKELRQELANNGITLKEKSTIGIMFSYILGTFARSVARDSTIQDFMILPKRLVDSAATESASVLKEDSKWGISDEAGTEYIVKIASVETFTAPIVGRDSVLRITSKDGKDYIVTEEPKGKKTLVIYERNVIGFSEDYSYFVLTLSSIFLAISMRYMLKKFYAAFFSPGLMKGNALDKHRAISERSQSILAMKRGSGFGWWLLLTFAPMVIIFIITLVCLPLARESVRAWSVMPYDHPLNYIAALVGAAISFIYMAGNMLWYGMGCAISAYRMLANMREDIQPEVIPVSVTEEDNPCILGHFFLHLLGHFLFALFLMYVPVLMYALAWIFTFGPTPEFQVWFPVLWFVILCASLYPLLPVRSAMKMAKEKELKHISQLLEECYKRYISLQPGDKEVDDLLTRLSLIEARHNRVKRLSLWPFNAQMLARILSLALALLPFIISLIKS